MGATTIEWTNATWNPLVGCSIASAGCARCYAARQAAGRLRNLAAYKGLAIRRAGEPAEFTGEVRILPERLTQPLRWRAPRMVFVNSMSDLFHPGVPTAYIAQVYAAMAVANAHTFQVLTKRPKRRRLLLASSTFQTMVATAATVLLGQRTGWPGCAGVDSWILLDELTDERMWLPPWPLPNVWEGVSVEDQANTWRLNDLALTNAAVRWVSGEPLLGSLDLEPWLRWPFYEPAAGRLDWVVVGGESGDDKGVRPMHPAWVRSIRDQCAEHGVPFLFKQWGEWGHPAGPGDPALTIDGRLLEWGTRLGPDHMMRPTFVRRMGKKAAGRVLDGVTHDGFPEARR
ncbi:MAG: hypothetical protein JWN67_5006 [Actinomycetia bacterium]|nr:hypothetical protein [Actinomycetes bacterium]